MAPAQTCVTEMVIEKQRAQERARSGSGFSHRMEMPWAQCVDKVMMKFVILLYVLIAVVLLTLVVVVGFKKLWKMGLMVSLIMVFWGCGLCWVLTKGRKERQQDIGWEDEEREDGEREDEEREDGEREDGERMVSLARSEAKQRVEGCVCYESQYKHR